jgi:exopolysaccharide biosynthesis polyprenyl glycosylphosphotransferase
MTTLFGHSVRWELLLLCAVEAVTYFCAISLLLIFWEPAASGEKVVTFSILLTISCALISGASGLYQPAVWSRVQRLVLRTAVAGILLLLAWPVLRAIGPDSFDSYRLEVLAGFASVILLSRLSIIAAARSGLFRQRIVAVAEGMGGLTPAQAARRLDPREPDSLFEVIEAIDPSRDSGRALDPERLHAMGVHALVAADPRSVSDDLRRRCAGRGIRVISESAFREQRLARVDIDTLPADWLREARGVRTGRIEAALHRLIDLSAGLALVAFTLPLMLLTALAIRLESRGPVFYRQERVGRNGRTFMLVKFRSMRTDAEAAGRPVWASRQDPRVTRVGRLIRRARIDEIPQVFNVLMGDMAFVGPRPERPAFVQDLARQIPHYDDRAVVKPGITGWAQVNYPYGASVEDARMKLAYDLYYIKRRSLFLDLLILIATVRVVLFQEGSR